MTIEFKRNCLKQFLRLSKDKVQETWILFFYKIVGGEYSLTDDAKVNLLLFFLSAIIWYDDAKVVKSDYKALKRQIKNQTQIIRAEQLLENLYLKEENGCSFASFADNKEGENFLLEQFYLPEIEKPFMDLISLLYADQYTGGIEDKEVKRMKDNFQFFRQQF